MTRDEYGETIFKPRNMSHLDEMIKKAEAIQNKKIEKREAEQENYFINKRRNEILKKSIADMTWDEVEFLEETKNCQCPKQNIIRKENDSLKIVPLSTQPSKEELLAQINQELDGLIVVMEGKNLLENSQYDLEDLMRVQEMLNQAFNIQKKQQNPFLEYLH